MDFIRFYSFVQSELDIYHSFPKIKDKNIEELNLVHSEIDLFLNRLELECNREIYEGPINSNTRFGELVQRVFRQVNEFEERLAG